MNKYTICFLLFTTFISTTEQSFSQGSAVARGIVKLISKTPKRVPRPYKIPTRTIKTLPEYYHQHPYSNKHLYNYGKKPNYPDDIYEFLGKEYQNNFEYYNLSPSLTIGKIETYETRRIMQAQTFLKEQGYLNLEVTGVWDPVSQKALKEYHQSFKKKLVQEKDLTVKVDMLDNFNKNVPSELLFYNPKLIQQSVMADIKKEVIITQQNLQRLEYYTGKIDGLFGPNSQKAMQQFKNDYNLNNTNFRFLPMESENKVKVNIEKGNDFISYWKTKADHIKKECSPSLCLNKNEVVVSLDCEGLSIELSTTKEISVSFSNDTHSFTKTFNSNTDDSPTPDCDINAKICLSKTLDVSFSICNYSFKASSSGSFKISASDGPLSKTAQIW